MCTSPVGVESVRRVSLRLVSVPRTMLSGEAPERDADAAAVPPAGAAAEAPATLPFELSPLEQPSAAEIVSGIAIAMMSRVARIGIVSRE
jgi:hypothetical protein